MPSLSFFIDEQDVNLLLNRLNLDPEIAFIVPDGVSENEKIQQRWGPASIVAGSELKGKVEHPRRWKAVRTLDALADGLQSLWHVPAGPLPLIEVKKDPMPMAPLLGPNSPPRYPSISDPWSGWTGTDSFGPGCHPWIRLELWTRHQAYTQEERATLHEFNAFWEEDRLVVSGFQWTGSHFRPGPPQTQRWWNRMKGWIDRNALRLPTHAGFSFWVFPSALKKLKSGMRYYSRGFDLDEAIRRAENPP